MSKQTANCTHDYRFLRTVRTKTEGPGLSAYTRVDVFFCCRCLHEVRKSQTWNSRGAPSEYLKVTKTRPHPNPERVSDQEPLDMLYQAETELKEWLDYNKDKITPLQKDFMWAAINQLHTTRVDWDFDE